VHAFEHEHNMGSTLDSDGVSVGLQGSGVFHARNPS
jgi:hypothetical protein